MSSKMRFWLKAGIAVMAFLLLDQVARNLELNKMVSLIQKSESQMVSVNEDNAYWYKLFNDDLKSAYELEIEVARNAQESAPTISAYGAQIESMFIFPWHRATIRAKRDYLDHNDAWVRALNADTVIDEKIGDERLSQEIRNTFEISKFSLPKAVPMLDFYSLESKVRIIFEN